MAVLSSRTIGETGKCILFKRVLQGPPTDSQILGFRETSGLDGFIKIQYGCFESLFESVDLIIVDMDKLGYLCARIQD